MVQHKNPRTEAKAATQLRETPTQSREDPAPLVWDSVPCVQNVLKCALGTRLLLLVLARLASFLPPDFDSSSVLTAQQR